MSNPTEIHEVSLAECATHCAACQKPLDYTPHLSLAGVVSLLCSRCAEALPEESGWVDCPEHGYDF